MPYKLETLQLLFKNYLSDYLDTRHNQESRFLQHCPPPLYPLHSLLRLTLHHIVGRTTVENGTIIDLNSHGPTRHPSQYRPASPQLSPQHPAPPTQLEHSRYLGLCQIGGITRHSARQCSSPSISTLTYLPLVLDLSLHPIP